MDEVGMYCIPCGKRYVSKQSQTQHIQTKKHTKNVELYVEREASKEFRDARSLFINTGLAYGIDMVEKRLLF
jgi:hypothetical protein